MFYALVPAIFLLLSTSAPAAELVQVGDEAPPFVLRDASGRTYDLTSFRGKNAVVLEFFRSGDW